MDANLVAECPVCFGEGRHDFRDMDAYLGEHFTDAELDRYFNREGWGGFRRCDECEGTGLVSGERARDLFAAAVAAVDQIIARVDHEDALRTPREGT